MTVEEIVQHYPYLRPSDVHDALAYAFDHLEEIEADLAADDEAAAQRIWPTYRIRSTRQVSSYVISKSMGMGNSP